MISSFTRLAILATAVVLSSLPGAAQTGSVVGTVFSAANGQPVRGAAVFVKQEPSIETVTDLDGKFQLSVSPGTYTIVVRADNYSDTEVSDIVVSGTEPVEASTVIVPKGAVTTVDVVEKVGAVASTEEAMLTERKLAAVVSDGISGEELRSGTASNAAGALEKVTGVSIVDNGYVYVRGLGERYSSTQLNNAVIPTTEPERRVVPLDLFPAALIDNIRILKTYTPDLPGEFSGGLVDMRTIDFPTTRMLNFSGTSGFNTRTTFNRFRTYPGGGRDIFGYDDGTRSIPAGIPRDERLFQGVFTADQLAGFGRQFSRNWEPTFNDSMRPNQSYSIVGGGTFGRFGLVGAISFNNKPQVYSERRNFYRTSGTEPIDFTSYDDFFDDIETTRTGGVFNLAMRLTPANKIVFRNTYTHDSDKESRFLQGFDGGIDGPILGERLRWIERSLRSHSVEGEHAMSNFRNSLLKWQMTYSRSSRNEPDLREIIRGELPNGSFQFLQTSLSGQRFYNDLADRIYEPQVDWSIPFFRGGFTGLFKVGYRATLRERDFNARRFRFIPFRQQFDLTVPSNELFRPENIAADRFVLIESTRGTDRYDANMDVHAGFAMLDVNLGSRWRIVGGLRVEDAQINVNTLDPLVPGSVPSVARLVNRDPLPGVNAIYALSARQNLRASYSKTLARPDFRELSPFDFTNVVGGFNTVGNPDLVRSRIDNIDLRWEWFTGGNQLIAASYFIKKFDDPVEVTIQAVADLRQSFINADGATNQGIELEFRRNLGFLSRRLSQFSVQSNFTVVDSDVVLPERQALILTSKNRPLVGQSRYVYNVITEWVRPQWRSNARFYVNSVSRRITDVGTFNLPDIYQERNTLIDFVYQYDIKENGKWSLRFAAQNLGDNHYRWTQAGLPYRDFRVGRTFEAGVSVSLFQ
ncbi:MAG: TonB-dependent receptor [Bryobacterales bacterium]|nr:TonB-dependent receptor [Bryobacterales bacterium]